MRFDVISLFPDMIRGAVDHGVCGRALRSGLYALEVWNPRDYTEDRHRTVDDRPFGGGPGMVMRVEPLRRAIAQARQANPNACVVYLSPQGRRFDQAMADQAARAPGLILLAGRYEGIDERIVELDVDDEWSIGDYVLSGGEMAALVIIDAIARLLPGALGHDQSAQQDSFEAGLLDCPHYTRPEDYHGLKVPQVLLSGNHEAIRRWRLKQALGRTWSRRPDLLERLELDAEQQALLDEHLREHKQAGDAGET